MDKRMIFEIHRLKNLSYSQRKIATVLGISRESVKKYLLDPDITPKPRVKRISKLVPCLKNLLPDNCNLG